MGTSWRLLAIALALVLAQSACSDPNSGNKDAARGLALEAPLARLRVRIQPIQRARLDNTDRVTGTVRAFRRAAVTAETQGRVIARSVESGAVVEP